MQKERVYKILLPVIFLLGVALRLWFYFKNQTLWYDEAALAVNIYDRSFLELFNGLDIMQAAPVGFTIAVKFLVNLFQTCPNIPEELVLRLVALVSGILALPAFYKLSKLVFENNKPLILTALAFFAFNPCAIVYSAQLKQYSTEMLVAIILLIIFYKMIMQNRFKWKYILIISLCPWFSYSSFFLIAAGVAVYFVKDYKKSILTSIPLIISCLIYYFVSLKSVFAVNYAGMDDFWSHGYGFIEFAHPLRLLIRTGQLFIIEKPAAILAGGMLIVAFVSLFKASLKIYTKLLLVLPFGFAILASLLHKYPFSPRLILFLLPIFIIVFVLLKGRLGFVFRLILCVMTLFCYVNFNYPDKIMTYSYAREAVEYLSEHIMPEDKILIDAAFADYDFYLRNYDIKNEIVRVPTICAESTIDKCRDFVNKLPAGTYYFLAYTHYVKEVTENNGVEAKLLDLGFEPKEDKTIYFKK